MSLLITRNTPMNYDQRMKQADRLGVYAVGFYVSALIIVASFGPQMMKAAAPVRRAVSHAVASAFSSVPLDAAFAAIVGVIVVVVGLAIRELRATEDKAVFDVR
jgi:hypothetical protein